MRRIGEVVDLLRRQHIHATVEVRGPRSKPLGESLMGSIRSRRENERPLNVVRVHRVDERAQFIQGLVAPRLMHHRLRHRRPDRR